jgi:hypothetical protein
MAGLGRALAVVVVSVVCVASSSADAFAVDLPTTANPLPGSTFQGADGNQVIPAPPPPGLTDWASLLGRPALISVADAENPDTQFSGGDKEDEPGNWHIVSPGPVSPEQANIQHAWSFIEEAGSPPNVFLYTASLREKAAGTSFLAVELNHVPGLWNNGHSKIPCRTTGDLQVVFEVHGNTASATVERWTTASADAGTGCARTGSSAPATNLKANVDLQAAWNASSIANVLPGGGQTIESDLFGEAALNLTHVLQAFGGPCFSYGSVWMHSRASESEQSAMKDFVAPTALDARSCTASGTKFEDLNANGVRDPGERGLKNFVIFADYNHNGVLDPNEPSTITDGDGRYRIDGITRPYDLREKLIDNPSSSGWECSFPLMTFPVTVPFPCGYAGLDPTLQPNVAGKDFLNFLPARLTVRKELSPADDEGRFELHVTGAGVDETTGPVGNGGALVLTGLRPGDYAVSEAAVAPTDPASYASTLTCASVSSSAPSETVTLISGADVECVFSNVRNGSPGINIVKRGPDTAEHGALLHYRMRVTNIGDVPFPADEVKVTDPRCNATPPHLVAKRRGGQPDPTPATLDPAAGGEPSDAWIYGCSRQTQPPADPECDQATLVNRATVTGTVDGDDFTSASSWPTLLTCPDGPPVTPPDPNPEPKPEPTPGGGERPVPPVPPDPPGSEPRGAVEEADSVPSRNVRGRLGTSMRRACVTRRARIRIVSTRPREITVSVDRRPRKRIRPIPLSGQYLVTFPVRRLEPGRHRLSVRVVYQLGSGSFPVTVTRRLVVCARTAPANFTG